MALDKMFTKSFNAMRELGEKINQITKSLEEKNLQKTEWWQHPIVVIQDDRVVP